MCAQSSPANHSSATGEGHSGSFDCSTPVETNGGKDEAKLYHARCHHEQLQQAKNLQKARYFS